MSGFAACDLRDAGHVVVFTGAGVSAESGIPTFRDALTGLWARYDPAALATAEAFERDPALVWGWYEWRRAKVLSAAPNAAHQAIAELAQRVPKLTVVTQNVDDLHERAGSQDVLHLHGSLHASRCFDCAQPHELPLLVPEHPEAGQRIEPPLCRHCHGMVRPGVVWFGESLPELAWERALEAARSCDLLLSVGTSGLVQPAAEIPRIALRHGAQVVHINLQPEPVNGIREYTLAGRAAQVLPTLLAQVSGQ
ncbi:NAD-dependent deacylase [Pseudomonas sp. 21LCFQ010]|uniref:SIR2 family NAD-dependent protein deacylase n=1 Tax=Pseudomonas sp. 21LCFQ010 TaxID=2957506 RepID=UPI002096B6BA|nr:NAD-dependent deacylase [Pseudomonas sp. 21LCFQ010]MCO8161309.1 NAD-dependent deacylase [Pseudomonas sp. 21LCFQ010]